MSAVSLAKDPYNIIITGVGGQGNVLASRLLGGMLAGKGYLVTIGETFGASQRGGSVMSHLRISGKSVASPQIPRGRADVIVSLEPAEAVRVMARLWKSRHHSPDQHPSDLSRGGHQGGAGLSPRG